METKETLLEIARELKLNNILENEFMSQDLMLLEILKRKSRDIDWLSMKSKNRLSDFDIFLTKKEDIPHSYLLGQVETVDQYGGEGEGDEYWIVVYFPKFDTYIRVDGWYASYDGGNLDGSPYIVVPKQKTITVYEAP
jgi:hypothetical protein